MNDLKAWRINDSDTYSGRDAGEAVRAAIADHGPHATREDITDLDDDDIEESPREEVVGCPDERNEDGSPVTTTVGAILDAMNGPGLVCSTEY